MNPIAIYQSATGTVDVRLDGDTVWLSQKQMSELFAKNVRTVSEHIRNVFKDGELQEDAVVRNFRITAADGKGYDTTHYNLAGSSGRQSSGSFDHCQQQFPELCGKGLGLNREINVQTEQFRVSPHIVRNHSDVSTPQRRRAAPASTATAWYRLLPRDPKRACTTAQRQQPWPELPEC